MINFKALRIKDAEGILTREKWNGLLDEVKRLPVHINPDIGRVGLGTELPRGKLHIVDQNETAKAGTLILGPINQSNLRLGYHASYSWIQSHGSKPLTINPLGNNVGIGVVNPAARLDVNGSVKVGAPGRGKTLLLLNSERSWAFRQLGSGAGTMLELANVGGGGNKSLVINTSGNVGIGTTNPVTKLSLGSALAKTKLALYQSASGKSTYGLGVTSGSFHFSIGNPKAKYLFWDSPASKATAIFTIQGSGRLFAKKLRNIGDKKNMQWNATTGEIGYDNSSRKDKTHITPLKVDFRKVLQLQPRSYSRPHDPAQREIGYIAEEAAALGLDPLLFYDAQGHPDGINYRKMCLYLVEVLRDHERRLRPNSPYLKKFTEDDNY